MRTELGQENKIKNYENRVEYSSILPFFDVLSQFFGHNSIVEKKKKLKSDPREVPAS